MKNGLRSTGGGGGGGSAEKYRTYMRWGGCFETANLKSFWVLFCTNGWVYFFPLKSKKFQGTNLQLWVGMIYFKH